MCGFQKVWLRIAKRAALPADVTPHVLRRSFASVADDLKYSEPTIAALIGHRKASVTSRYAHKADAVLLLQAHAKLTNEQSAAALKKIANFFLPKTSTCCASVAHGGPIDVKGWSRLRICNTLYSECILYYLQP